MIVGQTQTGPIDKATVVRSLAEYAAVYGARSGGTSMYDAAELAFRSGVSELIVARAFGPSALKATKEAVNSNLPSWNNILWQTK